MPPSRQDRHNVFQKRYFERRVKRTMLPVDSRYLNRHVDEALRFAGVGPDDRVLEVGCGMGRYTLILARRRVRVEGLDLSEVLLDRLRGFAGGRYGIPLHCADIARPPATLHGRFDVVFGFFTLHHVHELTPCFQGVAAVLKPGGRVVFLEPNAFNPLYYVQILVTPGMTWAGDGGIVRMRPRLILPAMGHAGLGRLGVIRFGFFPPFLANRPWGSRLEARLERFPLWRPLLPFQLFRGERL